MPNSSISRAILTRLRTVRSVRARTTLVAAVVVAVVLVVGVAGLATAVERTLTSQLQAKGAALVDAVVGRLEAGTSPSEALESALRSTRSSGWE